MVRLRQKSCSEFGKVCILFSKLVNIIAALIMLTKLDRPNGRTQLFFSRTPIIIIADWYRLKRLNYSYIVWKGVY